MYIWLQETGTETAKATLIVKRQGRGSIATALIETESYSGTKEATLIACMVTGDKDKDRATLVVEETGIRRSTTAGIGTEPAEATLIGVLTLTDTGTRVQRKKVVVG